MNPLMILMTLRLANIATNFQAFVKLVVYIEAIRPLIDAIRRKVKGVSQ